MKTVAIIPAKGFSRRIPKKNMKILFGKPLLYYTVTTALSCREIDEVYVSTDDIGIANFSKSIGAKVPFMRDPSLSGDKVHGTEPVLELLRFLYQQDDKPVFCIRMLPPCPFISKDSLTKIILKSKKTSRNVLSVTPLDLNINHLKTYNKESEEIKSITENSATNFQIDSAPELYALSGAAQCAPVTELLKFGTYHYDTPLGYPIERVEGMDLDTIETFEFAEKICPLFLK